MDIVKMITGNKSLQKMLIDTLTKKASENGITKIMIDLTKPTLEIEPVEETHILVDKETHEFYKQFFETNKNLING